MKGLLTATQTAPPPGKRLSHHTWFAVAFFGCFMAVWIFALPGGVWGRRSWMSATCEKEGLTAEAWEAGTRRDGLPWVLLTTKFAPPNHTDVRMMHHAASGVWAILAPMQLSAAFRRRWPLLHRWGGRLMATLAVPIIWGVALIEKRGLTYDETFGGGKMELKLLVTLRAIALGFLVSAAMAWWHARRREFEAHSRWARRYIALGMWVAVQRFLLVFCIIPLGKVLMGRAWSAGEARTAFSQAALVAAALCVAVAELCNAADAKERRSTAGTKVM